MLHGSAGVRRDVAACVACLEVLRMKTKARKAWLRVFKMLHVDGVAHLAELLGVTRQAVHHLRRLRHAAVPADLLKSLASIAGKRKMLDGSRAPTAVALVRLWTNAKEEQDADGE
jgi:hypothetical protein